MVVFDFSQRHARPISDFDSRGVSSLPLGHGAGATHAYCLYCEPGGRIGAHPTGFCQLFLVVQGSAWVAGADGQRVTLSRGQGAWFGLDEVHAKGSEEGGVVVMMQADQLDLVAPGLEPGGP